MKLTQQRLKEVLNYDPETGVFTWKVHKGNLSRIGKVAGSRMRKGYWTIRIDDKPFLAHRLAWLYVHGEWPDEMIDHVDQVKDNNRIANLRSASRGQNGLNRNAPANNTSGHKGVTWHKQKQKWVAQIKIDIKHIHLGLFEDIMDAVRARKEGEASLGVSKFCPI